ncbi:MAG: ATP-binding protein [Defluviicoccus sp.]|nr:ATP-binding protein [Defluviicoccus sp.]
MVFPNPFRPGAGHAPLHLAGRSKEVDAFARLIEQRPVLRNAIITGLRGVGKTVLLDQLKPRAQQAGWLWTGTDLTESASLTEERICRRLITDLSVLLKPIIIRTSETLPLGFAREAETTSTPVDFDDLWELFERTPGLNEDKIKSVLLSVRNMLTGSNSKGIVFAYDEAQNLSDNSQRDQYPLSILLDTFASIQRDRHDIQFLLVLTGLPTLFPRLNEARTYSERMFDVMHLDRLSPMESREAILKPIEIASSPISFSPTAVDDIVKMSGGYPYFIQYICKEVFDAWITQIETGEIRAVADDEITAKLDQDFFSARWDRATDRQQEFMKVIATLDSADSEFTTQEIVSASRRILKKGFSPSHATQILSALLDKGLVYRNRHGKYSFAVPLMAAFVARQDVSGLVD